MGNCLTCFKEPNSTALNDNQQNYNKEEMPEVARLYPAPTHLLSTIQTTNDNIISNGNHLSGLLTTDITTITTTATSTVTSPVTTITTSTINALLTTSTSCTTTISTTTTIGSAQSTPSVQQQISRFYPKRAHSKSAPIMGLTESKPSDSKLNALFELYKDPNEDAILAEGIEQFCKDLQVSPEDFRILVLAWKLNAEQMCRFTRNEFVTGLRAIRCDTIKQIQQRLPELVNELKQNYEQFKDLYRFTFKFGLDIQQGQRILPIDMAIILWRLIFTIREPPILERWLNFLQTHHLIRGIPRDTWNMFLNFSDTIGDDLSCYDANEAWPSLFDDFVEYENDQMNQNYTTTINKECDGLLIENDC